MADLKTIEAKIIELTALSYRKDAADLTVDTKFADLGSSSLRMAGLVSLIEDEYDSVVMSLPEAGSNETIGELAKMVFDRQ